MVTASRNNVVKKVGPTDKHVGSRVRMRRMAIGWSQSKLADSLGLTFQQIQKYEKGSNRIGSSRLQQIANLLLVPVSFFFEGGPDASSSTHQLTHGDRVMNELFSDRDGVKLATIWVRLSPEAKKAVLSLSIALDPKVGA